MTIPRKEIELFYFGTLNKKLFGCYHKPQSQQISNCGIVLCYPMADEYIRFHRAYLLLAQRLSRAGFPTMRFDYYGCGDSNGSCEQGELNRWRSDIKNAILELEQRCQLDRICLVGLRLGGTLSAMVGAESNEIDCMVLCDPIISGRAHIEELKRLHKKMLQNAQVIPHDQELNENGSEVLGFPLTNSLLKDIESVELFKIKRKPANKMLIIESNENNLTKGFIAQLSKLDCLVNYELIPIPNLWDWIEDVTKIQLPHQIMQAVVSWISEEYQ